MSSSPEKWWVTHESALLAVGVSLGLAVLVAIAVVGDANAFSLALGVESTILGLYAAFVAAKATKDARSILNELGRVKETAMELADSARAQREQLDRVNETAMELADSARAQTEQLGRLMAFNELTVLEAMVLTIRSVEGKVVWADKERRRHADALGRAMAMVTHLKLPKTDKLRVALLEADTHDYGELVAAALYEVGPVIWDLKLRLGMEPSGPA